MRMFSSSAVMGICMAVLFIGFIMGMVVGNSMGRYQMKADIQKSECEQVSTHVWVDGACYIPVEGD